jgi:hypothetical protein
MKLMRADAKRIVPSFEKMAIVLMVSFLFLTVLSRVISIYNDPPWWMRADFLCDEGWWADSARGKVFFDDYFSDDFGTAYLVTPGYTLMLETVYKIFGVGIIQTRMISAIFGVLTIIIVAVLIWIKLGSKEALLCMILLGVSPFYWAYNRVGLIETSQAFCITGAFCLYMLNGKKFLGVFGFGLLLSLAIALKPNAVVIGFLPLFTAVVASRVADNKVMSISRVVGHVLAFLRSMLPAFLGLLLGLSIFFIWVVVPHWKEFASMVVAESGAGKGSVFRFLTLAGSAMISVEAVGGKTDVLVWRLARWSPAIVFGAWLAILSFIRELSVDSRSIKERFTSFEIGCCWWMLSTWFFVSLSYHQPARRFIVLLPPMAIVATIFIFNKERLITQSSYESGSITKRIVRDYIHWVVLSLPAVILIKPLATRAIMNVTIGTDLGKYPGFSPAAAGTLFTLVWLALLIPVSRVHGIGKAIKRVSLSKASILVMVVLIIYEVGTIGSILRTSKASFYEFQNTVQSLVKEGETVLGHAATAAFLPYKVRTVRRTTPEDGSPPANPDVWDRMKPLYILQLEQFNYHQTRRSYQDLITEKRYDLVGRYGIGPQRNSTDKFVLAIYKRNVK